ncbi:hypothetical protein T10_11061 [Trichinella papuae]|uniref:Uncharacterized protein n=1 Tax=Trichinella papuae TaxID=268474 RepID=A0A0V1MHS4_9BILA|nr:hypothetical protein T10_11061 [Trichinella papuae]
MNKNKLLIRKQSTREDETRESKLIVKFDRLFEVLALTANQSKICKQKANHQNHHTITAAITTVQDDCTDGCRLSTKKRFPFQPIYTFIQL